jgi:hypothetical protein
MKRKIILLTLLLSGTLSFSYAQNRDGKERIKALKVAFITERLQLSADEAQKFWPIYNAYDETLFQLRNVELQNIKNNFRNEASDGISENEAQKMLDNIETIEAKIYDTRKKLVADLRKIISAKKIILLKRVEDDFNQELLEKLRERREKRFGNKN